MTSRKFHELFDGPRVSEGELLENGPCLRSVGNREIVLKIARNVRKETGGPICVCGRRYIKLRCEW